MRGPEGSGGVRRGPETYHWDCSSSHACIIVNIVSFQEASCPSHLQTSNCSGNAGLVRSEMGVKENFTPLYPPAKFWNQWFTGYLSCKPMIHKPLRVKALESRDYSESVSFRRYSSVILSACRASCQRTKLPWAGSRTEADRALGPVSM